MNKIQHFIFISLLFAATTTVSAGAEEEAVTSFTIGKYAQAYNDNLKLNKKLTIPDAHELEVTIIGKTEKCCDFLIIRNSNKKEIGKYSGVIDKQLTVKGNSIYVSFKSDKRTHDKGVIVKIFSRLSASVFNDIKRELLQAIDRILKHGTRKAYTKIIQNLRSLKTLQSKVNEEYFDDIADEITKTFVAMAQSYQEIAAMNTEIMATHQQQLELITVLKKRTLHNIEGLEKQKQATLSKLKKAQTKLTRIEEPLEKQKMQFSIDGYKSVAQSLYAQQVIWNKFYKAQQTIKGKLYNHSQNINLLLHILKINAGIYEQSANVALLRNTTLLNLKNITNIAELRKIIVKIAESEKDIKQWKNKIEQTQL